MILSEQVVSSPDLVSMQSDVQHATKEDMMKNKISIFLLMHFGFIFYSFYTVLGKFASNYSFLSFKFCASYCILIFILGCYAIIWQQVLKHIDISIAYSNKSITIIWAMIWGLVFFNEKTTIRQIAGALVIGAGIFILLTGGEKKEPQKEDANEQ